MTFECKLRVIFALMKQKDREFTQGKFAKSIGVSDATMSALVNEKQLPSFDVAYRIARGIGKPIEEIWLLKDE